MGVSDDVLGLCLFSGFELRFDLWFWVFVSVCYFDLDLFVDYWFLMLNLFVVC